MLLCHHRPHQAREKGSSPKSPPRPPGRAGAPRTPSGGAQGGGAARRDPGTCPKTMIPPKEKARAPKDSMTLLPCFYFVELPIVASSIVTLYFLELTDLFKPAKVGFQCYDRALSMPYVETNEELIPLLMLLSLAFAAPAASIMVGEGIVYCLQSRLKGRAGAEGSINAGGCNFNSFLRRTVRFVGVHVFGLCATALVTDVIQLATGYHAPFFLTVCKPNYTLLGTPCDANPYITQDICSGTDKHAILSARKTFPSQHATLSAFAAVYVSHQTPQAHPGLRLCHRRRHLRPDPDHPVPQPPRRRLRGLPDRLRHRRLPGVPRRRQLPCPDREGPGTGPGQGRAAGADAAGPRLRLPPEQVGEHGRAEPADAAGGGDAAGAAGEELSGQPEAGQRGRGPAGPPQPHGQGEHGDLQQYPAPRQHPLHGRPRAAPHDHPRPRGRLPLQAAHHRVEAEVAGGPEHDAGGGGGTWPGRGGCRRGRPPLPLPHGASALGRAGGHGAPRPHPAPAGRLAAGAHPRGEPGGRRRPGWQRGGRAGQVGDGGGEGRGAAGGQPPAPDAGHRHVQAAEHGLRHPEAFGDVLLLHQL
ncbi:phospholipid phosphatase-related protein type 3 isoform X4 [Phalacrocorax carbo]|uniref:phospholipid phosphatase-related protein type 3 isoform X4 n=1 Tax=Phalacrocorax carbo TaxID=9209 RepID=UPI003119DDEE